MFGFPVAPRTDGFKLQQNLLRTVIFQIKFPPAYSVVARHQELQSALSNTFPQNEALKYQAASGESIEQTPIVSTQQSTAGGFEFRTADQKMIFTVKEDELSLTILGHQYVNFQTVQHDLQESIYKVGNLLGLSSLTRTSIRKINLVNVQQAQFPLTVEAVYRSVFHNLLTLTSAAIPSAPYLFSGINNYRYHHDAHWLNLVYGLLPEPAQDGARQFVLDIDLLNTQPEQPYTDLSSNLSKLNDEVFNVFS